MAQLRSLWAEFKAFAFKGNMIDLAVAVVIGAAFSGVINSLVKDIIMPTISYAVTGVKEAKNAAVSVAETASTSVGLTTQPATQPTTTPATQLVVDVAAGTATPLAADPAAEKAAEAKAAADKKAADEKKAADDKKAAEEKVVSLDWKIGRINIGGFIAEMLNFVIIAFAVFMIIVKLLGSVMKRAGGTPAPEEPTTKECPECLSVIPIKAKRCAHCTAVLPPNSAATV